MVYVAIDFETFSEAPLEDVGAWVYSRHPSTEVLCMAYAVNDDPVRLWIPGDPLPHWMQDNNLKLEAHNISFEVSIWGNVCQKKYGFPAISLRQWYDTMAQCAVCAIPQSLDAAAKALDLPLKKHEEGYKAMLRLSKPREPSKTRPENRYIKGKYKDWDEKFAVLYEYCMQDVGVQRLIRKTLPPLTKEERELFLLTEKINIRGMPVDRLLADKAKSIIYDYVSYSMGRLGEITEGKMSSVTQIAELIAFLNERGIPVENARADTLEEALNNTTDEVAREVMQLRLATAKTSTSKVDKILLMADTDDRVRFNMAHHGARTGRVAGRGVQMTNLPRGMFDADHPEEMMEACEDLMRLNMKQLLDKYREYVGRNGKPNHMTPLDVVSSCIRGMFSPKKGNLIIAGDYANIEGRINAWQAGEDWKLEAFRDYDNGTGPDLYKLSYSRAFNTPLESVTKPLRQIGKVMELSLGYQGAVGAFAKMAKGYGVSLPENEVKQVISSWRSAHPKIRNSWYEYEKACLRSVISGEEIPVKNIRADIKFFYDKEAKFLTMQLPSRRKLYYYEPQLVDKQTPWGEARTSVSVMGVDSVTKQWVRRDLYGGLLVENSVQAMARDIMYNGMLNAERAGYAQLLTVYDESVAEIPEGFGSIEEFNSLLCKLDEWAKDIPITSESFISKRYRK